MVLVTDNMLGVEILHAYLFGVPEYADPFLITPLTLTKWITMAWNLPEYVIAWRPVRVLPVELVTDNPRA
jgi:hypothetical protein